jgi:exo-beta-1,3-glucanase (GH17 family)
MSFREEKLLSIANIEFEDKSIEELKNLYRKILDNGLHGLCFSPYMDGQEPGQILSEAQIRRRIEIIKPHTKWIRSFSCTEGNELIPIIAKEYGLKTFVGAWLGDDAEVNEKEMQGLIKLANDGYVDLAAVGNEVLYRGDLTEAELLRFLYRAKEEIIDVPIGYVDAYYEFSDRPLITEACDVIYANCYPFWEGCDQDYSLMYMKDMYNQALKAANGKRVIVSETGWPNEGSNLEGAFPSEKNAIKYFINAQKWSLEDNIEMFYFSSFDESWKVGSEGDVGAYWGIWDKDEQYKY